jgi:hypothetical protein
MIRIVNNDEAYYLGRNHTYEVQNMKIEKYLEDNEVVLTYKGDPIYLLKLFYFDHQLSKLNEMVFKFDGFMEALEFTDVSIQNIAKQLKTIK